MGNVLAFYRIMPEGTEVDLGALQQRIESELPDGYRINKIEQQPIAFGLIALSASFVFPDANGSDSLEGFLGGLPGVKSVEQTEMSLL